MANIILLGHRARTGKDTLASMVIDSATLNHGITIQRLAFANALKKYCGEEHELDFFNEDVKIKNRTLLIEEGCKARETEPDIWARKVNEAITSENVIITDFRFPNEFDYLIEQGHNVLTVRVDRDSVERSTDAADMALAEFTGWDLIIDGKGFEDLRNKSTQVLDLLWSRHDK